MSRRSLRSTGFAAAIAVLAAVLVMGVLQFAAADDGDSTRAETLEGFYAKTKRFICTSDVLCVVEDNIVARCRPGDAATGGSAWKYEPPNAAPVAHPSLPHGGNSTTPATGWRVDGGFVLQPDESIYVKAICADITP